MGFGIGGIGKSISGGFSKLTGGGSGLLGGLGSAFKLGNQFLSSPIGQELSGGLMDYAGGMIGAGYDKEAQKRQYKYNKALAKTKWMRDKSAYQNRYQWQMADMEKAGLNPMLAYGQAPPAGPSGAAPGVSAPSGGAASMVGAVSSARGQRALARVQRQQEKQVAETVQQIKAQTYESKTRAAVNEQGWHESIARQEKLSQETAQLKEAIKILKEDLKVAQANSAKAVIDENMLKKYPQLRQLESVLRSLGFKSSVSTSGASAGVSK